MKEKQKEKSPPESYGIYRLEMAQEELRKEYDRVVFSTNKSGFTDETEKPLNAIVLRMNELQLDIDDLKSLRQYKL